MQTDNRILDDLAKLATGAMGAAGSLRSEADSALRAWLDRRLAGLDLVTREEFEAVREMAARAREENERLAARIDALEKRGKSATGGGSASSGKASATKRKPASTGSRSRAKSTAGSGSGKS